MDIFFHSYVKHCGVTCIIPRGYNGISSFNSDLLQAAINASDMLPLPCIILGDFNGDPFSWNSGKPLKQQGFWDLRALHRQLYKPGHDANMQRGNHSRQRPVFSHGGQLGH